MLGPERDREKALSFSYRQPAALLGAGLSPGAAVISLSHSRGMERGGGDEGCSPGESQAPPRALAPSSHLTARCQNAKSKQ